MKIKVSVSVNFNEKAVSKHVTIFSFFFFFFGGGGLREGRGNKGTVQSLSKINLGLTQRRVFQVHEALFWNKERTA